MSLDPRQDQLLAHNYDGIQEYDNPMPRWWLNIFYASIVFSILYWLNVPGVGIGKGRIAEYEKEMAAAAAKYAPAASQAAGVSDAEVLAVKADAARLASGKATFISTCAACHTAEGGGNIGPNLADDFWIHGSRPSQICQTINGGVPDKGMPAWGQSLKHEQVLDVAAYVLTLRGTHPGHPKAAQGSMEPASIEAGEQPGQAGAGGGH